MLFKSTLFLIFLVSTILVAAQTNVITHINYVLQVDTSDLSGYDVEINIKNAPKTFHLAIATHNEYDNYFWKFVENFKIEPAGKNTFIREDSAVWKITSSDKNIKVKYRIHLPLPGNSLRPSWQPFLTSTGGLVGDLHSFMYVEEMAKMPATVTFLLPEGWKTSTGLISINNKNIYYAQDAKALLYSPAFVGKFQRWTFTERGIPHEIVYWNFSNVTWLDTVLLINNIKRIVHQTINFFGSAPYKNYTFLLHDGAYGAQEYPNSVTVGIPSENFKRDIIETNEAVAHEYFHAWNSMALRPAGYSEIHHNAQEKVKELWWNEGLTMFYTDLLLRRAGISVDDSTRTMHLQKLIGSYFSNPGNFKISPEKSSLETNEQPGGMGDYYSSVHLQGEVIGAMLDLIIRDATNSTKSIDDVMRRMFYDFPEKKGFSSSDVERTVENICGCDIHPFFEKYINNANIIDFNQYLKLIGKKVQVTWSKAMDNEKSSPDLINIFPWIKRGENVVRIGLRNPESCWGKAGLHTGDKVVTLNNLPINSIPSFRKIQGSLQVGDKAEFMINRNSEIRKVVVTVQGYDVPAAHITSIGKSTSKQKKLFKVWSDSK